MYSDLDEYTVSLVTCTTLWGGLGGVSCIQDPPNCVPCIWPLRASLVFTRQIGLVLSLKKSRFRVSPTKSGSVRLPRADDKVVRQVIRTFRSVILWGISIQTDSEHSFTFTNDAFNDTLNKVLVVVELQLLIIFGRRQVLQDVILVSINILIVDEARCLGFTVATSCIFNNKFDSCQNFIIYCNNWNGKGTWGISLLNSTAPNL